MNYYTIAVTAFLFIIINLGIAFVVLKSRAAKKIQYSVDIIKGCSAIERRKALRRALPCKAFVRRNLPEGGIGATEFNIRDISSGGLYMYTDTSSLFGPGEELEITIELGRAEYYAGKASVIHSEAVFDNNSAITESGIGIMFLFPPNDFIKIN